MIIFLSVVLHIKIVLTQLKEMRRLKVKYIVNLWIKGTSIQGIKCRVPLCPLKIGSTVYDPSIVKTGSLKFKGRVRT